MANIKSAKKRAIQAVKRNERNRSARSEVRTGLKKAREVKEAGGEGVAAAISTASSILDSAARKNLIHPNKAARLKSRLARKSVAAKD